MKDSSINLLVFDPSHTPQQMNQLHGTATSASGMRLIRKSLAAMKARQYQVVTVTGIMDTEYDYQVSRSICFVQLKNLHILSREKRGFKRKCVVSAKQNTSFH